MARLIRFEDCPCDGCKAKPCGHPAHCLKFADWINKTVDAVEVVRCKDCEFSVWNDDYNEWECVRTAEFNDETGQWYGFSEFVEEHHFCSYGERKDNERKAD